MSKLEMGLFTLKWHRKDIFIEPQTECSCESVCCSNSHIVKSTPSINIPSILKVSFPGPTASASTSSLFTAAKWGPRSLNWILWEWLKHMESRKPFRWLMGTKDQTANSKQRLLKLGWTLIVPGKGIQAQPLDRRWDFWRERQIREKARHNPTEKVARS